MNDQFSVEQSFQLINQVIAQARNRLEQQKFLFIFWGLVISLLSIIQYVLIKMDFSGYYYVNLLYILAVLYTFYYFAKRAKKQKAYSNQISKGLAWMWLIIVLNIFVSAFGFSYHFQLDISYIIMLVISIGYFTSAALLKSPVLIAGSIALNIAAYITVFINTIEGLLLLQAIAAFVSIFIPGVLIKSQKV